ncbi:cytochrome C assembly family protein [Hydrocarboniphaga sp.]|uniref:cytochrome C assembly family protein n=1 Tax=Hydrocarboniphaga sp. TaxID=2033016 RepID=UPI003D10A2EA
MSSQITLTLTAVAVSLYAGAGYLAWRDSRSLPWTVAIALIAHAGALSGQLLHGTGLHIGVTEALSLFAWQSAMLLWAFSWREPVAVNGIAVYPLAALSAACVAAWPSPVNDVDMLSWKISLHILISLLAAGVLTLAAVQAVALAIQERLLRNHAIASRSGHLPPLQMMERLLFQMVAVGFGLLSLTLLTGLWFIDDWMAQHLAHKTILSIIAWLVFGVLLWGRWRYGWRGRIAIRWALSGYGLLTLAYFGTKIILEQVLQKHWLWNAS